MVADGSPVVGRSAQTHALVHSAKTVFQAKRFIGRPFAELPPVDDGRFPFPIVNHSGRFAFDVGLPLPVSPEKVGSLILSTLRATAEKRLGVEIRKVVLAVPADFDEEQRNATRLAGELAGMEVVRIINEPTAAAMAYGLHQKVILIAWGF